MAHGLPCHHCVAHASHLAMAREAIVHWKDSTVGWKKQYEGLTYHQVSMVSIQTSQCIDPKLQYPPLAAPKCGRPQKVGRIKSLNTHAHLSTRTQHTPLTNSTLTSPLFTPTFLHTFAQRRRHSVGSSFVSIWALRQERRRRRRRGGGGGGFIDCL